MNPTATKAALSMWGLVLVIEFVSALRFPHDYSLWVAMIFPAILVIINGIIVYDELKQEAKLRRKQGLSASLRV